MELQKTQTRESRSGSREIRIVVGNGNSFVSLVKMLVLSDAMCNGGHSYLHYRHCWLSIYLRTPVPVDGNHYSGFLYQRRALGDLDLLQGSQTYNLDHSGSNKWKRCDGFLHFHSASQSEEALQDPVYHVLLRHQEKDDDVAAKKKLSPVVIARIAFSALGLLMLGTLIYTLVTDGSPFRKELLTPWMTALLIDFYFHVVILSIWVGYKESSWITASLWIVLLICFGSITTCAYIAKHVFQLSSEDPLFLVLQKNSDRKRI